MICVTAIADHNCASWLSRASGLAWGNHMVDGFLLGIVYTLAALLIGAMLAYGRRILEAIEDD